MPRILVVDDDPMVCMAIEVSFQRHGFEVTVADGGEAGICALETARFDVMLVDIFMPHMRGFELIRIFHERAPEISADRDVWLRLCEFRHALARFSEDDPRTRRNCLSTQAVYAERADGGRQRMSGKTDCTRSSIQLKRRQRFELRAQGVEPGGYDRAESDRPSGQCKKSNWAQPTRARWFDSVIGRDRELRNRASCRQSASLAGGRQGYQPGAFRDVT